MNTESTDTKLEFNQWADKLSLMSDVEVSYEIYNRIMNHSDIDKESLKLFEIAYEYCLKLIKQHKPLEHNLLKIYLRDVKGLDINLVNMMALTILLGICGITFSKIESNSVGNQTPSYNGDSEYINGIKKKF